MLGEDGEGVSERKPAKRSDVIAVLRGHGISGSVAAALWTVARDLRTRTRRRGIEHAITLNIDDGLPVGRMLTGDASRTDLTPHLLALQPDRRYVQLHTHPTSPSFSALDVRILADHPSIGIMIAVGVDGTWYVMSRPPTASLGDRRILYAAFLNELIRLQQAGAAPSDISHRVMERVAGQHGLRYDRVTGPADA
jgi:hypothetical protein